MNATSPFLNKPLRSYAEVLAERSKRQTEEEKKPIILWTDGVREAGRG